MSKTIRQERTLDDNQRLPGAHPDHPRNRPGGRGVKPTPSSEADKPHQHTRGAGLMYQTNGMNFMGAEDR